MDAVEEVACHHLKIEMLADKFKCKTCGAVKPFQLGTRDNPKWFPSDAHAKYFEKRGREL